MSCGWVFFLAVRKIIQIFLQHKLPLNHKRTVAHKALFSYQQNSLFELYCVHNVMTSTACFIIQTIWTVAFNACFGLIAHFISISGSNWCLCLWKCIWLTPEGLRIWPLPFSHYRKRPAKMRNYTRRVEY